VTRLSVNVNKIATVRNSRGGRLPSVIEAVRTCIDAGAPGITVHPRADARHITTADVHDIAGELAPLKGRVEYNIEGDPRPGFLDLVLAVKPDQCTLVPVKPGEITSEAGWPSNTPAAELAGIISALKGAGVRISLFVDPEPAAIRWARTMGADRVELYTEPFARAFERGPDAAAASFEKYAAAANLAHELGVGVNAGHDLDLKNLTLFKTLPHLDEVSIGHALVSRAIFEGLGKVVKEYLAALSAIVLAVSVSVVSAEPSGPCEQHVSGAAAHGTMLLERDSDGPRSLVDWLHRSLLS
jgi:pyridoxine 5-phosphate synthase